MQSQVSQRDRIGNWGGTLTRAHERKIDKLACCKDEICLGILEGTEQTCSAQQQ
jgi:hypothetical protein